MEYHIAQLNIAKARYPLDDSRMKEFVDALPEINRIGESSPGFVWILKDDTGTAVAFNPFNDPTLLVNMTVWETLDDMRAFAYQSQHGIYFKRRREWFDLFDREPVVLWWIKKGHIPNLIEGKEKMEKLWRDGPTPEAFSLKKLYQPE